MIEGVQLHVCSLAWSLQVIQEYQLALLIGRTLAFQDDHAASLQVSMLHTVQFKDAQGHTREAKIDLLFPATRRSVARVMEYYWAKKVLVQQQGLVGYKPQLTSDWALCRVGSQRVGSPSPQGPLPSELCPCAFTR
jgi:hypothetical protein